MTFIRFETSSTAMCYSLFELSQNQDIQDKARDSVRKVLAKYDGHFTYEAMMEMDYIENCISGRNKVLRLSFC
jgi:cytochrome P450 family 6